jgi:hypothetical protein
MGDDEQRLTEEARESLEKTQELREESERDRDDELAPSPGDDEVTDD